VLDRVEYRRIEAVNRGAVVGRFVPKPPKVSSCGALRTTRPAVANRGAVVGLFVPKPPKVSSCGALRTARPTVANRGVVVGRFVPKPPKFILPTHSERPIIRCRAQAFTYRIIGNVCHFFRKFSIIAKPVIEKTVLPYDADFSSCPAFPVADYICHVGVLRKGRDEVNVVRHYNGNAREDFVFCTIVFEGKEKLNGGVAGSERRVEDNAPYRGESRRGGRAVCPQTAESFVMRRVGDSAPYRWCIMVAICANGDEVSCTNGKLRYAHRRTVRQMFADGQLTVGVVHNGDIVAFIRYIGRAVCPQTAESFVTRRVEDNAPYRGESRRGGRAVCPQTVESFGVRRVEDNAPYRG